MYAFLEKADSQLRLVATVSHRIQNLFRG